MKTLETEPTPSKEVSLAQHPVSYLLKSFPKFEKFPDWFWGRVNSFVLTSLTFQEIERKEARSFCVRMQLLL